MDVSNFINTKITTYENIYPTSLYFKLSKSEYLFTDKGLPGKGGDKQKYWKDVLGFESAEDIRQTILSKVTVELLSPTEPNDYGDCYQAVIPMKDRFGKDRWVKTIWIVKFGEDVANFVTAIPYKKN